MLEGLEVSEVMLSAARKDNINNRIDPEYFQKQYINFLSNTKNLETIGAFAKSGYRVVYENTKIVGKEEATSKNFPFFLQSTDIETPHISTNNLFYVHQDEWDRYPKGRISPGEILIEVKGKLDKVAIVPPDFPIKTLVTGTLFKLTVNDKISKHYLLSYLICKYGASFKERFKTNLLVSYISKPDLYRIPVPLPSERFQKIFDDIFSQIFQKNNQFKRTYAQAEAILMQEVGLNDFVPSSDPINIKPFSESFVASGRLDAEYYQKKYEQVVAKLKSQPHDSLSNLAAISKSIEPGSAHYAEEGLPFMRVADYTKHGTTQPQKFLSADFVKANKKQIEHLKPRKGTILFSKDGSVGTAYHLREDMECITSGAILHLKVKDEKRVIPEYLTLALNSNLVQMQAERDAGGSIILHWRVSEIENVVVPVIDFTKQQEIAALVEESFSLKQQSESLLEVAKRAVEIAIEQDEAQAEAYIKKQASL